MVVCFYLEYNVILVIEFYDTCIIFKDTDTPIVLPQFLTNPNGRSEDCFLEHAFEMPRAILIAIFYFSAKGLVATVLTPCLSDSL